MAKSRRKAPTAKQLAARAKFAARFGGKKTARRGAKRRAAKAASTLAVNTRAPAKRREEEEETMLEENPRRKRRKKSKAKRKGKARRRSRKGTRRRARRAAPRRRSRRRSRRAGGRVHVVRFPSAQRVKLIRVKSKTKPKRRRRGRGRRRALALLENPSTRGVAGYGELFDNPSLAAAYSMDNTKAFLMAAGGIAFGLVLARGVDRYIATMKPADSGAMTGQNPWYGRDAALVQNSRPGALRLGVQGVGALAAIGAAYATRNNRFLPWALGGTALGFGSNLMLMVAEWFILPRIPGLKVENASEQTFANRMYVTEQVATQDTVVGYLEAWDTIPSLADGQQNPPIVQGILQPGGSIYALGGGPGKLAGGCGCGGGCGGGCGCNGGGGGGKRLCSYVVQPGDNLAALLAAAGVGVESVNALNNGNYWVAGNQVILPHEMCVSLTGTPAMPNGGDGTIMFQPVGPGSAPSGVITDIPGGAPVIPYIPPGTIRGTEEQRQHYVPTDARADNS